MTTAASERKAWAKPFFIGICVGLLAFVVVAGVALFSLYRAQGDAYCADIAQAIQRGEAQGSAVESNTERLRRQYEEECR